MERTRTHPDQIGTCALIRPTTWVSIAPESAKTLPNRKIVYEPGYQDKNDPRSRLGDHVLKAFFGETGRAKHAKHFQQKIDYFEIEQIFIPIIEEEHWSLAIVNHPRKAFKKLLQGITRQQVNKIYIEYLFESSFNVITMISSYFSRLPRRKKSITIIQNEKND